MNDDSLPDPVHLTSRIDSHEVLDWTDLDICTDEEKSWPAVAVGSRVDSMTILEPEPLATLVLKLVPIRPIFEIDKTTLAGDVKLLRYALDDYDRSLGGDGFTLVRSDLLDDSIVIVLMPLRAENASERLNRVVAALRSDAGDRTIGSDVGEESPLNGLVLVRPRFGRLDAEIVHPSKA